MKQQDIAMIMVIAFISGMISFFLSGFLFGGAAQEQTVSKVDAITPEFIEPDNKYFNENSENPTPQIQIGDSSNENPFKGDL